jgi:hypothetical protein
MGKPPKGKPPKSPSKPKPSVKYACRCYALIDGGYEMYTLNADGSYDGPFDCTEAQCRKCNMSKAQILTKPTASVKRK